MSIATRLEQCARDFELTVADKDWSRVARHSCENAVREEHELPLISLRHEGVEQIISEWRQMVEKFDLRFDHRIVAPLGRAKAVGNRVTLRWIGVHAKDQAPEQPHPGLKQPHRGWRVSPTRRRPPGRRSQEKQVHAGHRRQPR